MGKGLPDKLGKACGVIIVCCIAVLAVAATIKAIMMLWGM